MTSTNEVLGYWSFLVGVSLGLLGLVTYFATDAATTGRGIGYAVAALAPAFLMTGAVLRFPLRRMATYLVGVGAAITLLAVAWFVLIFPSGWSTSTGHTGVILTYITGLGIIGIAGSVVPLATDPQKAAAELAGAAAEADAADANRDANERHEKAEAAAAERESELRSELSELKRENAKLRASRADDANQDATEQHEKAEAAAAERESALRSELSELKHENAELRASKADEVDLERTITDLERGITDTEAERVDLAAEIQALRTSQAQFELYEDTAGEHRWRLRHRNGNLIADSGEGYTQRHNAQKGMQSVRRNALGATTLFIESEAELPETTEGLVIPAETESQAEFELYEDTAGEYRWRLRHENGNIIAGCGEGYASRNGAKTAIERVRRYVGPADYLHPDPTAIEVYRDVAGGWRWRLVHRNGNVLASSGEGYASRSGVRRVIDSLREDIGDAEIEVYEDESGGFRWRLAGGDTRIKADSSGYESHDGATDAVERLRRFLPEADLIDIGRAAFEVYEDTAGEYRWRLRHRNGNILADGREGYSDRSGAWRGIESVKRNAPNAGLTS
uniref:HVO_2922 family protein n=1 Tax=Haloplanus aerogenes TaxID=660522 RepID=UPI0013149FFC|nr:HVO_2922 family protein [Haloplanus aerogenes]